jgi:hypothetical protein
MYVCSVQNIVQQFSIFPDLFSKCFRVCRYLFHSLSRYNWFNWRKNTIRAVDKIFVLLLIFVHCLARVFIFIFLLLFSVYCRHRFSVQTDDNLLEKLDTIIIIIGGNGKWRRE